MGIFGKQLQEREKNDRKIVQAGERMLAETIGKSHLDYSATDPFIPEDQRQVELIAQYIRIKTPENIQPCRDLSEMLDVMLHPSGAAKRRITLTDKWWIESDGPILAVIKESGQARALFPGFLQGLYYLAYLPSASAECTDRKGLSALSDQTYLSGDADDVCPDECICCGAWHAVSLCDEDRIFQDYSDPSDDAADLFDGHADSLRDRRLADGFRSFFG